MGGRWRWALVSLDGVAPSPVVGVFASVNLPLYHKVQSLLLGPAHPGGPGKRAVKWLWVVVVDIATDSISNSIMTADLLLEYYYFYHHDYHSCCYYWYY